MHRNVLWVLAGCAVGAVSNPAKAQGGGIKLADVAGTWNGKSMVGPKDSVFTTWVLTATADGKGVTYKRPGSDAVPVRVVTFGGDSIVTEMGPLPSTLRPGETVTTVRVVGHYKGNTMAGTWEARYASGGVARGKVAATREK